MLTVEDVRAGYDRTEVLHGVSLEVNAGELVTVLGANGAGKTTLLRTISHLTPPRGGRITFDGEDITGLSPHGICRRGLIQVPEGRKLFPLMTIDENLQLGAMPGAPRARRTQTLEQVRERFPMLADRRRQLAGTLSGGEQQQLALGRALMGLPRMLLLDEPTQGLAPVLASGVLEAVADLRASGLTVLLVSQEVASALDIADRAYVLETGSVVLAGTAEELAADENLRAAYLGM
jgi:branched-chain amino acid transport system ATP-binding protein